MGYQFSNDLIVTGKLQVGMLLWIIVSATIEPEQTEVSIIANGIVPAHASAMNFVDTLAICCKVPN